MRRVIIESPYAGDVERNIAYAKRAVKDSLKRGEAPIASHLLYTQEGILDDQVADERRLGIEAGHEWMSVADAVVFYLDYEMSTGMSIASNTAYAAGYPREFRYIGKNE